MTNDLTVSFLYFDGCPLAPRARENLFKALGHFKHDARVGLVEVDLLDSQTPEQIRQWGSPTILLNGEDLAKAERGSANNCRIYPSADGVPSVEEIVLSISEQLLSGS